MIKVIAILLVALGAWTLGPSNETAKFFKMARIETISEAKTIQPTTKAVEAVKQAPTTSETQAPVEQAPEVQPQPVAVAEPTPVYATGCENYRGLVSQYGWNVNIAMQVMSAESGCNPYSANPTDPHETCNGSYGLFQIACMDGVVYDPAQNVAIAWRKYQASGWRPWGVCGRKVACY